MSVSSTSSATNRPHSSDQSNAPKKSRKEKVVNSVFNRYPAFVIIHSLKWLTFSEIVKFDLTAKGHRDLTNKPVIWNQLAKQDLLTSTWSDCEAHPQKERMNYYLSRIARTSFHFFCFKPPVPQPEIANQVNSKLTWYSKFPNFNAFMKLIVGESLFDEYKPIKQLQNELEKLQASANAGCIANKWGGDIFLQSVIQRRKNGNEPSGDAHRYTLHSIRAGAVFAVDIPFSNGQFGDMVFHIEAAKLKYYQPLENSLAGTNAMIIQNLICRYDDKGEVPPLYSALAQSQTSLEDKEKNFQKAIDGYGNKCPRKVYFFMAETKIDLKKYNEGNVFLDRVLEMSAPFEEPYFSDVISKKSTIKKFEEVYGLLEKRIQTGNPLTNKLLFIAANVNFNLGKYEKANEYYSQIKDYDLNKRRVLILGIVIKFSLAKKAECEQLINEYMSLQDGLIDNRLQFLFDNVPFPRWTPVLEAVLRTYLTHPTAEGVLLNFQNKLNSGNRFRESQFICEILQSHSKNLTVQQEVSSRLIYLKAMIAKVS